MVRHMNYRNVNMHTCEPPAVCAVSTHPSKQHQQVQMMRDWLKARWHSYHCYLLDRKLTELGANECRWLINTHYKHAAPGPTSWFWEVLLLSWIHRWLTGWTCCFSYSQIHLMETNRANPKWIRSHTQTNTYSRPFVLIDQEFFSESAAQSSKCHQNEK